MRMTVFRPLVVVVVVEAGLEGLETWLVLGFVPWADLSEAPAVTDAGSSLVEVDTAGTDDSSEETGTDWSVVDTGTEYSFVG